MTDIEKVLKKLQDDPIGVNFDEVIQIGAPAVDSLCNLLNHEDDRIASDSAKALGYIGDKRAVEPLLQVVSEEDLFSWTGRWLQSVVALGRIKDAQAVEPLCEYLLMERNVWSRSGKPIHVAKALGEIGDSRAARSLCQAMDKLEQLDTNLGTELKNALIKIGSPSVPYLCQVLLKSKSSLGRSYAAMALSRTADSRAIEPLCQALKDEENAVRTYAKNTLNRIERETGHRIACLELQGATTEFKSGGKSSVGRRRFRWPWQRNDS